MDTKKQKKPLLIAICILSALLFLGLVLGLTVFFKFHMSTIFSNRGSRLYSPAQIRDIKSDAYDKGANDFVDDKTEPALIQFYAKFILKISFTRLMANIIFHL